MSGRWVDLRAAAELLGTSTEAIRKRAARGSLESSKENGRVLVWVDDGRTEGGERLDGESTTLISRLEDEVRFLREELARKDAILLRMAESIPAREAPEDPPEPPEPRSDGSIPTENPRPERSWWRRVFGFD